MRLMFSSALALCLLATSGPVHAGSKEDVRDLYNRFVSAQNARDLAAVRRLLSNAPDFLWVSDGMPVWGADAMIARMSSFQKSEVWRVEPDFARSRAVEYSSDVAMLHLPLTLAIGASDKPDRLRFLVGMVGRRTGEGWRIEALFTTADKMAP